MKFLQCPHCSLTKPVCDFSKHKGTKSGFCWCKACNNEASRVWLEALKTEVFSRYGTWCEVCKESDIDVLTLDHIDQKGAEHRLINKISSGWKTWRYVKQNNWPTGFRVLCFNCNTKAYRNFLRQQKEST